jgi:hypothetical protein
MNKVSGPTAVTKRALLMDDEDWQRAIVRAHPGELKPTYLLIWVSKSVVGCL